MTIFKRISVEGIFDFARKHISGFNDECVFQIFKYDALYAWGQHHGHFFQYHHPDILQAFHENGEKLFDGTLEEERLLYSVLTCSEDEPCKKPICPLCQLDELEAADALLAPQAIAPIFHAEEIEQETGLSLLERIRAKNL